MKIKLYSPASPKFRDRDSSSIMGHLSNSGSYFFIAMKAGVSHKVRGGSLKGKEEDQYSSWVLAVLVTKVAVALALEIAMAGMEPEL